MKNIFFFWVLVASFCYAQETKFVLIKNDKYFEEYYVRTNDTTIKHGTYVKYKINKVGIDVLDRGVNNGIQLLEIGNFTNGERSGIWEKYYNTTYNFFYKNKYGNSLETRGLYVNGKKNGVWFLYFPDTTQTNFRKYGKEKIDSLNISVTQPKVSPKLIGKYINDKRVGEWVGLDKNGKVLQRYNFTSSKLILDTSIKDSLLYNLKHGPLFIGGVANLYAYLLIGVFVYNI